MKLRRLWLLAIMVYVGLDLCLPEMPGAFMFDADGSVESVDVARTRLTPRPVVLPLLATASLHLLQPAPYDLAHRLPSMLQPVRPRYVLTRCLPRAICAPPHPSEDLY